MAKNQYEGLTEQQIAFCDFYLDLSNGTQSAIKAGYSKDSAYSQASRLLKNDKIKAYLDERRKERQEAVTSALSKYAEDAVKELYDLMMNAESESVKMQAIKDVLDRAGHKPVDKVDNRTEHGGQISFGFVDPNSD